VREIAANINIITIIAVIVTAIAVIADTQMVHIHCARRNRTHVIVDIVDIVDIAAANGATKNWVARIASWSGRKDGVTSGATCAVNAAHVVEASGLGAVVACRMTPSVGTCSAVAAPQRRVAIRHQAVRKGSNRVAVPTPSQSMCDRVVVDADRSVRQGCR